jgi:gliding motility-associated-like protein
MLMWSKPNALDTIQSPGPYTYKIYHSADLNMNNPQLIKTINSPDFNSLKDTTLIDSLINTVANPYSYKIEFYCTINSGPKLLGKTVTASSVFLNIRRAHQKLELKWNFNVPWRNTSYTIYRKNNTTGIFDSIGYSNVQAFTDTGLVNGTMYCYYVRSTGSFYTPGFPDPILNNSQKICTSPRDTIPPCALFLDAKANCDLRQNFLLWNRYDSCTKDVNRYKIYFSDKRKAKFILIDSVMGLSTNNYTDTRASLRYSLAGCYYVTAVDSFDNESLPSNEVCLDNCPKYDLPNIFTPDGDGINDNWEAMNDYRFVQSIDLIVFNRWGQEVYHTTKPDFAWNGKDEISGRRLSDGVYYYICTANEIYLDGIRPRQFRGVVTILH